MGLWTGIGLVIANMIGVGVMLSAGFMAVELTPAQILVCWLVGGVMAMAGARAYAAVAALIPRSGGEYRYLSDLAHPWLGYLAGWTSLLVGFAAPVAVTAGILGPFAQTLDPGLDATAVGAAAIVIATLFHAFEMRVSRGAQNLLVAIKVALVVGFVVVGLVFGARGWPTWKPVAGTPHGLVPAFMGQLLWVAYAYTGWNAAAYAAGDFRDPRRTVPRAMMIGCALVAVLYLAVNWVFVANLTPGLIASFVAESRSGRITLGHVIARALVGDTGATVMSAFMVVSLLSTISAMTFVGPRIYATMAADGYLPRAFRAREGRPPMFSVLLQGALALVLFLTHTFDELLENVGAILALISALTVATLFRIRFGRTPFERPSPVALVSAAIYIAVAGFMLYYAVAANPSATVWMALVAGASVIGWRLRFG